MKEMTLEDVKNSLICIAADLSTELDRHMEFLRDLTLFPDNYAVCPECGGAGLIEDDGTDCVECYSYGAVSIGDAAAIKEEKGQ